eukprot:10678568-Ditylum_brightwellii.AAC.1
MLTESKAARHATKDMTLGTKLLKALDPATTNLLTLEQKVSRSAIFPLMEEDCEQERSKTEIDNLYV